MGAGAGAEQSGRASGREGEWSSDVCSSDVKVEGVEQVAELCGEIRRRARRPVIICIDQEGGRVIRLGPPFTAIPSMRAVGGTGDEQVARAVGWVLARELS